MYYVSVKTTAQSCKCSQHLTTLYISSQVFCTVDTHQIKKTSFNPAHLKNNANKIIQ